MDGIEEKHGEDKLINVAVAAKPIVVQQAPASLVDPVIVNEPPQKQAPPQVPQKALPEAPAPVLPQKPVEQSAPIVQQPVNAPAVAPKPAAPVLAPPVKPAVVKQEEEVAEHVLTREDLDEYKLAIGGIQTRMTQIEVKLSGIKDEVHKLATAPKPEPVVIQQQPQQAPAPVVIDNSAQVQALDSKVEQVKASVAQTYATLVSHLDMSVASVRNDVNTALVQTRNDLDKKIKQQDASLAAAAALSSSSAAVSGGESSLSASAEKRISKLEHVIYNQADIIMKLTTTVNELQSFIRDQITKDVHKMPLPQYDYSNERSKARDSQSSIEHHEPKQPLVEENKPVVMPLLGDSAVSRRDPTLDYILQALKSNPAPARAQQAAPSNLSVAAPVAPAPVAVPTPEQPIATPAPPQVVKEQVAAVVEQQVEETPSVAEAAPAPVAAVVEQVPVAAEEEAPASPATPNVLDSIERKGEQLEVVKRATMKGPARKKATKKTNLKDVEESRDEESLTKVSHESVEAKLPATPVVQAPAPAPVEEEKPIVPAKKPMGRGMPLPGMGMGMGMGNAAELLAKLKRKD